MAPLSRLWWLVLSAATVATVAKVIFYFILTRGIGEKLLTPNQFPPPELVPMPIGDVAMFSVIWSLGAGLTGRALLAARLACVTGFLLLLFLLVIRLIAGNEGQVIAGQYLVGQSLPAVSSLISPGTFYRYLAVIRFGALLIFWFTALLVFWHRSYDWVAPTTKCFRLL